SHEDIQPLPRTFTKAIFIHEEPGALYRHYQLKANQAPIRMDKSKAWRAVAQDIEVSAAKEATTTGLTKEKTSEFKTKKPEESSLNWKPLHNDWAATTSKPNEVQAYNPKDNKSFKEQALRGHINNSINWTRVSFKLDLAKFGMDRLEDDTSLFENSDGCGDSAEAFARCGLSAMGQVYYGMFPLRYGKAYENDKELRYGHLMIMADPDHDGSHFKRLLINFLHSFCPSLLKVPNFMLEFITPIVKASNKETNDVLLFYTMPECEAWKEKLGNDATDYKIKYYKGGKDHASGRYLFIFFTQHSPITRYIFHKADELLLNYLNDNGQSQEMDTNEKKRLMCSPKQLPSLYGEEILMLLIANSNLM
ncbi:DNA topoisomerase 2, partial [Tanacetum coccineum]